MTNIIAYNGAINLSGALVYSGTGTPLGVVSAPVGSIFLRTDGGVGTSLYVKESGSGNTGWAALNQESTSGLPSPDQARYMAWEPAIGGSSFGAQWDSLSQADGGSTVIYQVPTSTNGGSIKVSTSSLNNGSYHAWTGSAQFYGARGITFKSRLQQTDTINQCTIWTGLTAINQSAVASQLMFKIASGTNFWQCITGDDTTGTAVVTSVPVDTNPHSFEIDYTPGVNATFKIDGNVVAVTSTNLPSNSTAMAAFIIVLNQAFVVSSCAWQYVYATQVA